MADQQNNWQTLESNPDVLTRYARTIGMSPQWQFVDVLSCDPALIPASTVAFLVVLPLGDVKRDESLLATIDADDDRVLFVKQAVPNACGTIGVIHAVANNAVTLDADRPSSLLAQFARTDLARSERAKLAEASAELAEAHEQASRDSVSQSDGQRGDLHFVCFTTRAQRLFELDGRTPGPLDHGDCADGMFVERFCSFVGDLMLHTNALTFSITALCRADNDVELADAVEQLLDMGVVRDRSHAMDVLAANGGTVEGALAALGMM